nr:hypothetical protein [Burkholderia pyrrocinia]
MNVSNGATVTSSGARIGNGSGDPTKGIATVSDATWNLCDGTSAKYARRLVPNYRQEVSLYTALRVDGADLRA